MQAIDKDFCIFILTHGRANNVKTYKTLRRLNCKYPIYFVIDNEDKQANDYYDKYGKDKVIMFDKQYEADNTDEGDNFNDRRAIIYARNACFDIALKLGFKYFIELDDDYEAFYFKFDEKLNYGEKKIKSIDSIFTHMLQFYKNTNFDTIAFAQNGDYVGGGSGMGKDIKIKRKAMNSFICSTDRPFRFVGRVNEDVNTYVSLGSVGRLFGTINMVTLKQTQTQQSKGGMTELYKDASAHWKPFYTVMYAPSCVKISLMGNTKETSRLHHKITWKNAVPKILPETFKKLDEPKK